MCVINISFVDAFQNMQGYAMFCITKVNVKCKDIKLTGGNLLTIHFESVDKIQSILCYLTVDWVKRQINGLKHIA